MDPVAMTGARHFWWRWLLAWSAFFVLFGVATAWLGALPPASLWGQWVAEHFGSGGAADELARVFTAEEERLFDFMRGPLGGTMAGSYVMQTALVAVPIRRGERWAWWAVFAGVFTWFIVDSVVSLLHGAYFNVLLVNLFALAVTLLGLLGCRPSPSSADGETPSG